MPLTSEGATPEEAASCLPAGLMDTGWSGLYECRLVLVPVPRGSDALALIGWAAEAPLLLLCALLRSWEDRFGARAVAMSGSELYVSVARPPVEAEHASLLALEHVLSTADNIVDDPPKPFPEYAAELVGRTSWSFWWDWAASGPACGPEGCWARASDQDTTSNPLEAVQPRPSPLRFRSSGGSSRRSGWRAGGCRLRRGCRARYRPRPAPASAPVVSFPGEGRTPGAC
jgi:uncharacterized protein DUF4253